VSGVQFIVQIILARLLLPEDYGIIALIVVFIAISQTFVQSGLGTALIQKKEVTDEDYSSVFYLTLVVALVFYGILFLAAPFIAAFYNQPLITPVLRVLGLTLFFGAINTIQNAVIARNFQFRKLFISSLGAVLLSGVVGIAMAYAGYGVWALVGQQLTSIIALCAIMWLTVKWRPKLLFSLTRVKIILIWLETPGIGSARCNLQKPQLADHRQTLSCQDARILHKRTGISKCGCLKHQQLDPGGHFSCICQMSG